MPLPIEDYALIGDCQSVALVGKDGSIDWMCLPRFDSPACFTALLGTPEHGRWLIAPEERVIACRRQYREGTLILETELETENGVVALIDFMPPRTAEPDLIRIVEGRRGRVAMHTELTLRFDYGSIVPWVRRTERGIRAIAGPDTIDCRTKVDLIGRDHRTCGQFVVEAGQRIPFELVWTPTYSPEPRPLDPERTLEETENWWLDWSARCTYTGPWQAAKSEAHGDTSPIRR